MFIPRSPEGNLVKALRQTEQKLQGVGNVKMRLVEESGASLRQLLTSSNPWKDEPCKKAGCYMCTQKEMGRDKVGPCKNKSVVYQSTCTVCREVGKTTTYTGETGRGVEERLGEHLRDGTNKEEKSHMYQHLYTDHPEMQIPEDPRDLLNTFEVKALHNLPRPLHRQIMEALAIGRQHRAGALVLNQKQEYNRCLLPELMIQDTSPTANLENHRTPEDADRYPLENTSKRDTKAAGTRHRIVRRKRPRTEKARIEQEQDTGHNMNTTEQTPSLSEEQVEVKENTNDAEKPEEKKRKATENSEDQKSTPQNSAQNSTQEKKARQSDLLAKLRGTHTQPTGGPVHNPSTHKATQNPKHKGKLKITNPHIGTVPRGKRRSTRDSKVINNNSDIRSFFKSIGDQLRDRETEQTKVHAGSERIPGDQEIPRDPGGQDLVTTPTTT